MKLYVPPVEISRQQIHALLCSAAVADPDVMEREYPTPDSVKKVARKEVVRVGLEGIGGWADSLNGGACRDIYNWAFDLLNKHEIY